MRDAVCVRAGHQRSGILGNVSHCMIDELGSWMARNPLQPFVRVVSQQRRARHCGQGTVKGFQCRGVGCDAFGV